MTIYTVRIKHALGAADCGPCGVWSADCGNGLGIKHELRFKTGTKHYGLGIKRGLRYKMWTVDLLQSIYLTDRS